MYRGSLLVAMAEAYAASDPKDEKKADRGSELRNEAEVAFRRCFAERAKSEKFFAAVTRQAQAAVGRLPR
jgi:hypothetical protein